MSHSPFWPSGLTSLPPIDPYPIFDTPEQELGFLKATVKVTPVIINLPTSAIKLADKLSSLAGMGRDCWVSQLIEQAAQICSKCGFERSNHHDPINHFGTTCLNQVI